MNETKTPAHLVFLTDKPIIKSYHRQWQRKLAALVDDLDATLLTRDEINDLVSFLKERVELDCPGVSKDEIHGPNWTFYEKYNQAPAIIIGHDMAIGFRGVNPTPGGSLSNYLADLDIDKIYKTIKK